MAHPANSQPAMGEMMRLGGSPYPTPRPEWLRSASGDAAGESPPVLAVRIRPIAVQYVYAPVKPTGWMGNWDSIPCVEGFCKWLNSRRRIDALQVCAIEPATQREG